MAVAGALLTTAAFGFATPWLLCRRPPYDGNVCPHDAAAREKLQKARLKWIVTLVLVSLGLLWWEAIDVWGATRKLGSSWAHVVFRLFV